MSFRNTKNIQRGISLIESILVAALSAVILFAGFTLYRAIARPVKHTLITLDITDIHQALVNYFTARGCDTSHHFLGSFRPSLEQLHLQKLKHGRTPYIIGYSAEIVTTEDDKHFGFQITAELNEKLPTAERSLIANATHAQLEDDTLIFYFPLENTNPSRKRWLQSGIAQCYQ